VDGGLLCSSCLTWRASAVRPAGCALAFTSSHDGVERQANARDGGWPHLQGHRPWRSWAWAMSIATSRATSRTRSRGEARGLCDGSTRGLWPAWLRQGAAAWALSSGMACRHHLWTFLWTQQVDLLPVDLAVGTPPVRKDKCACGDMSRRRARGERASEREERERARAFACTDAQRAERKIR